MRLMLAEHGIVFSTRDRGRRMLEHFENAIVDADSVVIDLAGVRSISYSFADAFIGTLMTRSLAGELPPAELANVSESASRSIKRSLDNREIDVSRLIPA